MTPPGRLERLLRPRTLAVLGGGWAEAVVRKAAALDGAEVWPVHPMRTEMAGVPCLRSLTDLPAAPDAAFLGVNRDATLPLVAELAGMGAGGAVLFSSGWAETGEGARQAALVDAAGAMPVLGPNCYGLLNYLDRVAIWPDEHGGHPVARGAGIIAQSSNIAINLTMQARGLPIGMLACLGNAAAVPLAELGHAMLEDERITALGFHAEGIGDAAAFAGLVEAAAMRGRGVVVLKGGRSAKGAQAALSHTAAMTGDGAASTAFLARAGAVQVRTPAEMVEALKLAHVHGPIRPRRIVSMSCSGGEAGLVADLAADLQLDLPSPDPAAAAALTADLGPMVPISNPLDYHTFIWGDRARIARIFRTMASGYDAGIVVIDPPDRTDPTGFEAAIEAVVDAQGVPLLPVASLPETMSEARAHALLARGVCPMGGLETALSVLAAQGAARAPGPWRPLPAATDRPARVLPEDEAKALIASALRVPRAATAPDLATLVAAAAHLRPPFALKALGHAHKTEAGAVRLGVLDLAAEPPMAGTGYLCEEMAEGTEILVSLRRDPVHGARLTLGWGGTMVETLDDTAVLILPVTAEEVDAALAALRVDAPLRGHRGAPTADRNALIGGILALSDLFVASPAWEEVEINPLMAGPHGAVAVDALLRIAIS